MDRGAWWATAHGVAKPDTTERLSTKGVRWHGLLTLLRLLTGTRVSPSVFSDIFLGMESLGRLVIL